MSNALAQNELLFSNRAYFAAELLNAFALGVYVLIAGMSLYFLNQHKSTSTGSRVTVAYTWSMLLITIGWSYCSARVTEVRLIENHTMSQDTTGMVAYCSATNIARLALCNLQFLGTNALLLFRLFMLFDRRWTRMIVPGTLYLSYAGICMTRSLVCLSSQFGGKLPFPPVGLLTDVFSAMTASVPIVFTSMICFMLLRHRRLMMRQGGALCDKSFPYLSIIAILVESAVPYAVCSWIWVVLSITSNPAIDWFNGVFTAASFFAEAFIVLRISMGHAYPAGRFAQAPEVWNEVAEVNVNVNHTQRSSDGTWHDTKSLTEGLA